MRSFPGFFVNRKRADDPVDVSGSDSSISNIDLASVSSGLPLHAELLQLRLRCDRKVWPTPGHLSGSEAHFALSPLPCRRLRPGSGKRVPESKKIGLTETF